MYNVSTAQIFNRSNCKLVLLNSLSCDIIMTITNVTKHENRNQCERDLVQMKGNVCAMTMIIDKAGWRCCLSYVIYEPAHDETNILVSDQIRQKSTCACTEKG